MRGGDVVEICCQGVCTCSVFDFEHEVILRILTKVTICLCMNKTELLNKTSNVCDIATLDTAGLEYFW